MSLQTISDGDGIRRGASLAPTTRSHRPCAGIDGCLDSGHRRRHDRLRASRTFACTWRTAGRASSRLAAIDFVNPTTGWVVAELTNHDFALLNTVNGGDSWTRQLSGPGGDIGEYANFFDS